MKARPLCLRHGLLVIFVVMLAAACGGPAAPTPVPNATPVLLTGPQVKYDNVQLTLPAMLGSGVSARLAPRSDAGPDEPFWAVYPEHVEFVFTGFPAADSMQQASVEVYVVSQARQMNPSVATAITELEAALGSAPTLPSGKLPVLPLLNANQVFQAQVKFLDFKNGRAIRFITQYDQGPTPINNHEIFYTFQGLTKDGAYYVAAVLPVHTPFLAPDEQPGSLLPPDGVLMPDLSSGDPVALFTGYLQSISGKLNATADNQFTPTLDVLDELMQSVEVK
jgi:hypothetical protein